MVKLGKVRLGYHINLVVDVWLCKLKYLIYGFIFGESHFKTMFKYIRIFILMKSINIYSHI
jgi:hypothetical protein